MYCLIFAAYLLITWLSLMILNSFRVCEFLMVWIDPSNFPERNLVFPQEVGKGLWTETNYFPVFLHVSHIWAPIWRRPWSFSILNITGNCSCKNCFHINHYFQLRWVYKQYDFSQELRENFLIIHWYSSLTSAIN